MIPSLFGADADHSGIAVYVVNAVVSIALSYLSYKKAKSDGEEKEKLCNLRITSLETQVAELKADKDDLEEDKKAYRAEKEASLARELGQEAELSALRSIVEKLTNAGKK